MTPPTFRIEITDFATLVAFVEWVCGHATPVSSMVLTAFGPVGEQSLPGPETPPIMTGSITDSQYIDLTWSGKVVDKRGNLTTIEAGSFKVVSSDPSTVEATLLNESPIVIRARAVGPLGVAEVYPTADADLGGGVSTIEGERVALQVMGGQAVGLGGVTLGTPVEQPDIPLSND